MGDQSRVRDWMIFVALFAVTFPLILLSGLSPYLGGLLCPGDPGQPIFDACLAEIDYVAIVRSYLALGGSLVAFAALGAEARVQGLGPWLLAINVFAVLAIRSAY